MLTLTIKHQSLVRYGKVKVSRKAPRYTRQGDCIGLLFYAGLRRSESAVLTWGDIVYRLMWDITPGQGVRFGPTPKLTGDQVGELRRERGRRLDQESDGEIRDESGEYLSIAVTG